jgi:hypothetical protein
MPQGLPADTSAAPADDLPANTAAISRRQFVTGAGATGIAAASGSQALPGARRGSIDGDGTPEQIHLTWGEDPARIVHVSWASPAAARNPRVQVRTEGGAERVVRPEERQYKDGLSGQTVFTYHATLDGLEPGALVHYSVTADNDRRAREPFAASFRTAPGANAAFRFTSYGDLATPNTAWALSSPQSRHAVAAVERFAPLFHLLNGDLCYANLNPQAQPSVWADFGNNVQTSAAQRPWMPCTGNHEIEFGNGALGLDSYLTRYRLPHNGTAFPGCWYSFQVGSVLFISLSADDVIYQESGAFVTGPEPLLPAPSTGNPPLPPGSSIYLHGYSGGAQTRWLEQTLARAAAAADVDWIVVQMHQDAMSSSKNGNGCDKGIRDAWLPLFDRYGVDLVLCGHDHDYERSWPVRGCNHDVGRDAASGARVDTRQPRPVLTAPPADGVFDTSHGTIHFILGGGGTSSPVGQYGTDSLTGRPQAKVITRRNAPHPGTSPGCFVKPGPDALEEAIWSARRDTDTGYGIAVCDVDPGAPAGKTSITIAYYHATGADREPNPHYELFETIVLAKQRRDAG